MKENRNIYSIIIGFDHFNDKTRLPDLHYAQKDALDLYNLLTDPRFGNCPKSNTTLITQHEIRMQLEAGKEYDPRITAFSNNEIPINELTTKDLKTILYTQAVTNRSENDTVIIYYSGHGFKTGKKNLSYLATPDISHYDIQNNPEAGLQMEYIYDTIFGATSALSTLIVLDCCYSGTFIDELVDLKDFNPSGKVIIVSSQKDVISRESEDYKNGIFTHHLLDGLRGADPEVSGEVTITKLFSYLKRMCPSTQSPALFGDLHTRIVLTKPEKIKNELKLVYKVIPSDQIKLQGHPQEEEYQFSPLKNPLDDQIAYADIINNCILGVDKDDTNPVGNKILSIIRCSLDAEFAFLLKIEEKGSEKVIIYKYESDLSLKGFDIETYKKLVINILYPQLTKKKNDLMISRYGYARRFEGRKDAGKYLIIVPLHLVYPREFMILCGVDADNLKYGEIIGRVLASVYDSTNELASLPILDIESAILDDIKRDFGHVPYHIYQRQFELFKNKLRTIKFSYEPVVKIRKRRPEIHSWEALARDPLTDKAPTTLFHSAELWGPQFTTELDLYCLENAIQDYLDLWQVKREKYITNNENPMTIKEDPLAINVYPETLFRDAYKKKLTEILEKDEISEDRLILEISEKQPIPTVDRISESEFTYKDPIEAFVQRIHDYTNDLRIRFAIDDFGVGHSSISRLYSFDLDYIKIDREILLHSNPGLTIDYVKNFENAIHQTHPSQIVVEGFDQDSRITLKDLYSRRIEFVQGHKIRKASHSVEGLSYEETKYIIDELSEETTPNG